MDKHRSLRQSRRGTTVMDVPKVRVHGVDLGISEGDVDKFGTLFRMLDHDDTGTICEEQLADLMPRMGVFLSEEGLRQLFRSVDEDESGSLDFGEFLVLMARHREANHLALMKGGRDCFNFFKAASQLNHVTRSDSVSSSVCDLLTLVTIMFYVTVVLYEDVRQHSLPVAAGPYLKTAFGVYCIFDLWRWSRTAFPPINCPDVHPVDDAALARGNYARSWACLCDALAALPLDLVFMYMGNEAAMRGLQHLRLLKFAAYPRLFRLTAQDAVTPAYARFYFAVVPSFRILFQMGVSIHVLTTLWILVSPGTPEYIPSMYFIVYTLTTVGYGDNAVVNNLQRVYCMFLFCCATVVTGLVVGKLVQIAQQGDVASDMNATMLETLAALSHLHIPPDFREEILAFQLHRLKHSHSVFTDTFAGLPECMQERMALYARMKVVRQMTIFADVPDVCAAKVAQALINVFAPPEEYIVIAGEEGGESFFLFHGMCCVTRANGKWIATIKRGGLFGEAALLTETRRTTSIKSLTYCQLFRLDKAAFKSIIEHFPEVLASIQRQGQALHERINDRNAEPAGSVVMSIRGVDFDSDDNDDHDDDGDAVVLSQTEDFLIQSLNGARRCSAPDELPGGVRRPSHGEETGVKYALANPDNPVFSDLGGSDGEKGGGPWDSPPSPDSTEESTPFPEAPVSVLKRVGCTTSQPHVALGNGGKAPLRFGDAAPARVSARNEDLERKVERLGDEINELRREMSEHTAMMLAAINRTHDAFSPENSPRHRRKRPSSSGSMMMPDLSRQLTTSTKAPDVKPTPSALTLNVTASQSAARPMFSMCALESRVHTTGADGDSDADSAVSDVGSLASGRCSRSNSVQSVQSSGTLRNRLKVAAKKVAVVASFKNAPQANGKPK